MTWRELINDIMENHSEMLDTPAYLYIDEHNDINLGDTMPIDGVTERFTDPRDRARDDNELFAFLHDRDYDESYTDTTIQYDLENIDSVRKFTDLKQVTASYVWNKIDPNYNCHDALPCWVSEDHTLIICAAADIVDGASNGADDWADCWCFEWLVFDEDHDLYGTLAEYNLGSPYEAFRVAMRYKDALIAGDNDNYNMI